MKLNARLTFICAAVAVAAAVASQPASASSRPEVLCGNFGGETAPPHLARKPGHCEVTTLSGLPDVDTLSHMTWTTWNKHPVGRGLVNGTPHRVRLKQPRPCGRDGEFAVYSKMSIDGRAFRPILYCGD